MNHDVSILLTAFHRVKLENNVSKTLAINCLLFILNTGGQKCNTYFSVELSYLS